MKYLLILLSLFASANAQVAQTNAQVTQTNAVSTNAIRQAQYTRLNLRDRGGWDSFFANQRASSASMWQTWWSAKWGTNATVRTNANPVAPIQAIQPQTNQLSSPPQRLPQQPPPQQPTNAVGGLPGSAAQSAISIDNLNNTVWRDSGWKIVNPYEGLLRDMRMAGMAQRQFGQSQGMMGGMNGQMGNYGSQMGGGVMGNQFGQQQGGNYGNSNNGMGSFNNMFNGGGMDYNFPQGLNSGGGFDQFNSGQQAGAYAGMIRGRMSGMGGGGYGGMSTFTTPYF